MTVDNAAWRTRVRLADRVVPLERILLRPTDYRWLFSWAKARDGHGCCLCRAAEPLPLVIRYRDGGYHLAVWPGHGHLHARACGFWRPPSRWSGHDTPDAHAGFTDTDTGVAIRLDTPLILRSGHPTSPTHISDGRKPQPGRPRSAATLLGMLHWLWDTTGLAGWRPEVSVRRWRNCHLALTDRLRDTTIDTQSAAEAVFVVPPYTPDTADANAERFTRFLTALGTGRRGLLVGEVKDLTATDHGVKITIAHLRAPLYCAAPVFEQVRRAHRAALAPTEGRRIILAVLARSAKGYPTVVDMAVMATTRSWVPVESHPELVMANALTAAGRDFVKPVRYAAADAVVPDFVLLDTDPPSHVQVWGVPGREEHEQRKQHKQASCNAAGNRCIDWDTRDPLPDHTPPKPNTPTEHPYTRAHFAIRGERIDDRAR